MNEADNMNRLLIVVAFAVGLAVAAVVAIQIRTTAKKRIPDGIEHAPRFVPLENLDLFQVQKKP
jgi:hypothetical protein